MIALFLPFLIHFFPKEEEPFKTVNSVCSRSTFWFPWILLQAVKCGPLISELAWNGVLYASCVFLNIFWVLLLCFPSCVRNSMLAIQKISWKPGGTLTSEHIWSEIVTFINLYALDKNAESRILNSLLWKFCSPNSYQI